MLETMSSQLAGGVGVGAIPQRRVRGPAGPGRRESKVAYRNHPSYSTRHNNAGAAYPSSPEHLFSRNSTNDQYGQLREQSAGPNLDILSGYFDVHRQSAGNSNFNSNPVVHQNLSDENSWLSISSPNSYTLVANLPNSSQNYGGNHGQSPGSDVPQMSGNNVQEASWNTSTPQTSTLDSEMDDMSMSDLQIGSFGSFNSLTFSAANTAASSNSDTYVFPITNSNLDSAGNQLQDLVLPNGFHRIGPPFDAPSPGTATTNSPHLFTEDFPFDHDGLVSPIWTYNDNAMMYATESGQWSATTLIAPHQTQQNQTINNADFQPDVPWNSQFAQDSHFQLDATAGGIAFEPIRGAPYETHLARQDFLDAGPSNMNQLNLDHLSPNSENDSKSWALISNPSSSYAPSHGSPTSQNSPLSHAPSPPAQEPEVHHSHIFNSIPSAPRAKATRGRQRGLTAVEKKQARDVREAKACWACHISKTKCSPCSPGKPCEQCARLAGKRRFCLFSCFNDPLESLYTFLVPSYLMGHFTKSNVESFVTRNASSWGTQHMLIRMDWGYPKFLEAEVVALALRSSSSEMGFFHQTVSNGNARPQLVRKSSPPLGIPLAAMDEMQDAYSKYIQDIVQSGIASYIPTAYIDQESELPTRLLEAVASFYSAGHAADNESELLRRALEMHVTSVILERSLFLDPNSLQQVQSHLGKEYHRRSSPRCAQRQIKLAFFMLQQRRIQSVLKDWGAMIWATNPSATKDKEWALAFSVFLILILVMDKTLGAAYFYCEGRIKHHGHQASTERVLFQDLVHLTQKELFERCKEIFHWKFKTRKGGKEACNPIRDGIDAFQGKSKTVDRDVVRFVMDLQRIVGKHEEAVRLHRSSDRDEDSEYTDAGRLACIFLDDFLSHV
ncbi:hypothetical protein ONS95_001775 [Cadophora gregata]|uniref:uncharacterized protein n=1 Tax=Cadophora gregata TaxID=51156 RepID=UPI0026DA7E0A|nr:uncharacterized protein ONS95_001775 [Cadophora gregata]KAK0111414.1 hypothetical protein ONS95_001775 [Cadophora gregata]